MDSALQRQLHTISALLAVIAAAQVYRTVFGPFTELSSGFGGTAAFLAAVGLVVALLSVAAGQAIRALSVEQPS